jgi:hypothetical protein
MKKVTFLYLYLITSSLNALSFEFFQLYKDSDIIQMGGANIGLGGLNSSIFHNPAGLSQLKKSDGFEIKLFNMNLSTNYEVIKLIQKEDSLLDKVPDLNRNGIKNENSDKIIYINNRIKENIGKNGNFDGSNFSSLGKKIGVFGISFGLLTSLNLNLQSHQGFGSEGVIETNGLFLNGFNLGFSYDITKSLSIGVGGKYLKYLSIKDYLTIDEVLSNRDKFITYLDKYVAYKGTSVAIDIGLLYKIKESFFIGFSAMNLGGVGSNKAIEIPETINLGLGYKKRKIKIGVDYIDLTENYGKSDIFKRVKSGIEYSIIDNSLMTFKIGGGLYQSYYTAGASFRFALFKIGFATYAEELGINSQEREDRRYIVNLTLGW